MSYAASVSLQKALFASLKGDPAIEQAVGDAVFDATPSGRVPETYISIGPEDVRDWSDKTGRGAQHDFTISIVTGATGFQAAKQAAGAVSDLLLKSRLDLERGRLVSMDFLRARASRAENARLRRIDLRFRARIEDTGFSTAETK